MDRPGRKDLTDAPTERMPQPSDAMNLEPSETNSDSSSNGPAERDSIAARAYRRFEERGREHGHDLDDWLEAERELESKDAL
jgi:hypothetical protein